jgi:hypothetical protein
VDLTRRRIVRTVFMPGPVGGAGFGDGRYYAAGGKGILVGSMSSGVERAD